MIITFDMLMHFIQTSESKLPNPFFFLGEKLPSSWEHLVISEIF